MTLAGRRIALVEDDEIMGGSLHERLELEGAEVVWLKRLSVGLGALRTPRKPFDAVICDIRLPDGDGETLYHTLAAHVVPPPFLFITGHGGVEQAVRLMRAGAADYILKPFEMGDFLAKLAHLAGTGRGAEADTAALGVSEAARQIERRIAAAADLADPVLVTGGPGLGKARIARRLHALSDRRAAPFLRLSLARGAPDTLDARLFGAPGAAGLIDEAGEGTLLIEAVERMPASVQERLLARLEAGGDAMRFVTTGGPDAAGALRGDLYWHLARTQISVPPLADRPEDAVWLMERLFARMNPRRQTPFKGISSLTEDAVRAHDWPGGGRELRARLRRAMELGRGPLLFPSDMFEDVSGLSGGESVRPLAEVRDDAERAAIRRALEQTGGRVAQAAGLLGVSRTTLWEKMHKLGMS